MQVIDLNKEHEPLYFVCLEDWSDEMKEAGNHRQSWYEWMQDKGLRVKLALDEDGQIGGMIEYMPIEHSYVEGSGLYLISCIWVHGHKKGRGNFQKHGMGTALLTAAEEDARARGSKGMAAYGLWLPFWIRASWFKKHGYTKVDSHEGIQLLLKPFSDDAVPPRWIKQKHTPELMPGKVTVTSFIDGRCPSSNMVHERAKRASQEFGDKVIFRTVDTRDKDVVRRTGEVSGLYIDGKRVGFGPPLTYEKIRGKIAGRVKKLS
jgi:GNAT superfamily N-acetyltransferase